MQRYNQNLDRHPFGTFSPSWWIAFLVRVCHALPKGYVGTRLAFLIRKPIIRWGPSPLDVELFGLRCRLYPNKNLSDKRLLTTPFLLDGPERDYLQRRLPARALVLDVGANVGGYTLLLLRERPDLRVVAFEPDPELATRLSENLKFSGLLHQCLVQRVAITDHSGTVRLSLDPKNQGQNSLISSMQRGTESDSIEVPGQTLLAALDQNQIQRPDFLKLDIEGHELTALGALWSSAPKSRWPILIQIEQQQREALNAAVQLCIQQGYQLVLRTRMNVILEFSPPPEQRLANTADPKRTAA